MTPTWLPNSGSVDAVASFYAPAGRIVINRGAPWEGRAGIAAMAAGFFADVPDLHLVCDGLRAADDHAIYLWTYTGTDAKTGQPVQVSGWEEWELDDDLKVKESRGVVRHGPELIGRSDTRKTARLNPARSRTSRCVLAVCGRGLKPVVSRQSLRGRSP